MNFVFDTLSNKTMYELESNEDYIIEECPICYEENIKNVENMVILSCNHKCCFNCFRFWFLHKIKTNKPCFQCFFCRANINYVKLSNENKQIIEKDVREYIEELSRGMFFLTRTSPNDIYNYNERRVSAIRFFVPMLFFVLIYLFYYDNDK